MGALPPKSRKTGLRVKLDPFTDPSLEPALRDDHDVARLDRDFCVIAVLHEILHLTISTAFSPPRTIFVLFGLAGRNRQPSG
jgi:hypothetical protein